jgi:hypothetical protein
MLQRLPDTSEYAPAFGRYVQLVPELDVLGALTSQLDEIRQLLTSVDATRAGFRYAEGKWSIREIVGHFSDAERIFGYRMHCIARGEEADLPGFDEDSYIAAAGYDGWPMADLIEEFVTLRQSNILLLRNLQPDAWERRGKANGNPVSVRAIAYAIVGHVRHHRGVLRERYSL